MNTKSGHRLSLKVVNTVKLQLICCLLLTGQILFAEAAAPREQILTAYSNMQYSQARQLAQKHPELPEARVVLALCAVLDHKQQNLDFGLPELKKFYNDKNLDPELRLQAGLTYARAVQTLQMRHDVYPIVDGIDFNLIYNAIQKAYPSRPEACFAAIYQAQDKFESGSPEKQKKGITDLKNFLDNYKGAQEFTAAVYILLADRYIISYGNYSKAVHYLLKAIGAGIVNPHIREDVLFRIGRTYDLKLKDKTAALKYYRQFIREYPNSSMNPVIERYIRRLGKGTT